MVCLFGETEMAVDFCPSKDTSEVLGAHSSIVDRKVFTRFSKLDSWFVICTIEKGDFCNLSSS